MSSNVPLALFEPDGTIALRVWSSSVIKARNKRKNYEIGRNTKLNNDKQKIYLNYV